MQVGAQDAQDGIDLLRLHAGCAQAVQERDIELMEAGKARSVLVVAGTAVQQHGVATGADQPGMDAADQTVFARRLMMRHQPVEMACQHLPLETVEIVFRRSAGEANLLLYPDYRHVSDRPGRHRNLLSFPLARRPKGQNMPRSSRLARIPKQSRSGHAIVTFDHS
jgi:hypothetical protein